jgi:hypothetical protein
MYAWWAGSNSAISVPRRLLRIARLTPFPQQVIRAFGAHRQKLTFQHALSLRSKVSTNRFVHWSARLTDGISG